MSDFLPPKKSLVLFFPSSYYLFYRCMDLFALALIPAAVLLVYIYKMDTVEKEPMSLLLKCLCFGALATVPAYALEKLLNYVLVVSQNIPKGSVKYALITGFVIAGGVEELCKFLVLRKLTWKNKNFDCFFDGIVYAVFVSLGFAALENIFYVAEGGASVAISRMFTAVPGHCCFGVCMGYYYSLAKTASVEWNLNNYRSFIQKAIFVPMIIHGIYDSLIMTLPDVVGNDLASTLKYVWTIFICVLFRATFRFVNSASKFDKCFYDKGDAA